MDPWEECPTRLVRSLGAPSNSGDGRQRFPWSPGFLAAGRCQLSAPGEAEVRQSDRGRHSWGPYQGWPGIARGTCGEGRACVCVCVCVCVMTEGSQFGQHLHAYNTSVGVSLFKTTHSKADDIGLQSSLLPNYLVMHTPLLWQLRPAPVPQGGTHQRHTLGISGAAWV